MLKRIFIIITILLSVSSIAVSQGTTGFELLRSEVGGRGAAMAGAMIAVESGIDGLFYNPAALGAIDNRRVDITYLNHLLDIESGFIAYGHRVENVGVFGASLNYMNYGEFQEATAYGELTGSNFHAADLLFTLGYGRKLNETITVGGSFKYINSEIWDVHASAYAFDLGAMIYTPFDNTKLGIGIFNIGSAIDGFYDYEDELPLAYKVGFAKPLAHLPLEIALQLEKHRDSDIYLSAGGEFTISEMLRLRLGWSSRGGEQQVDSDKDIFAGASFGLGFQTSGVLVDYSLTSMGELGTLTRFSIGGIF